MNKNILAIGLIGILALSMIVPVFANNTDILNTEEEINIQIYDNHVIREIQRNVQVIDIEGSQMKEIIGEPKMDVEVIEC